MCWTSIYGLFNHGNELEEQLDFKRVLIARVVEAGMVFGSRY